MQILPIDSIRDEMIMLAFRIQVTLLIFGTLLCALALEQTDQQKSKLAGRTIAMAMIRSDDLSPRAWPTGVIALGTQSVTVKSGDSIFSLLESNNIQPDSEAYTLVYDLNPTLDKLDPLIPGHSLLLPSVSGGSDFRQLISRGHLVMLTVDPELKFQLRDHAAALVDLSGRFARLESRRFADPLKRQETIKFVKNLTYWFNHMGETYAQHRGKPLRRVTLLQTTIEAETVRLILEQAVAQNGKLSEADQAQISAIHKDVEETIKRWDETMGGRLPLGESQFRVVVNIRGNDPRRIEKLRVYYVVEGLFRDPPTNPPVRSTNFSGLGSGSSAVLPIKDYKVWASEDGDPMHPATPFADLRVRRPPTGDTISLELSLKSEPKRR